MRVLMTGGGTGGHVYPALAIAEIIKNNWKDAEIAFVGTERGIENNLVPKEGYKLYHIEIQGIKRSISLYNLKTAYLVMVSPGRAKKIIKEFEPDVVIGTGGYVCWPLLKAASSMGVPTIVHESNALPGVAVRQLQDKVDVILTNFEATAKDLKAKDKVRCIGNPLRNSYSTLTRGEARAKLGIKDDAFMILSFGGSLGAPKVNEAVIDLMKRFSAVRENVVHYHASGNRNFESARVMFSGYNLERNPRLVLNSYIYDMPTHMAAADMVICRAGAMTLTEIAMMSKPSILIPSPNVTDNHQYKNAKVLADEGGAILIEEKDLTSDSLLTAVEKIADNAEFRNEMSGKVAKFAIKDVNKSIYNAIKELTKM